MRKQYEFSAFILGDGVAWIDRSVRSSHDNTRGYNMMMTLSSRTTAATTATVSSSRRQHRATMARRATHVVVRAEETSTSGTSHAIDTNE